MVGRCGRRPMRSHVYLWGMAISLLWAVATSALEADGSDVLVPCATQTTYGGSSASISDHTRFVISGCISTNVSTVLRLLFRSANLSPLPANVSVLVQHSVNVEVTVDGGGNGGDVLQGLVVAVHNVSNPVSSITCATSVLCKPLLTLRNATLHHPRISVVDTTNNVSARSAVIALFNVTTVHASVMISNCIATSYVLVAQAVHFLGSNVTIANTTAHATSPSTFAIIYVLHMYWVSSEIAQGSLVNVIQSRLLASVSPLVQTASVALEKCHVTSSSSLQFLSTTWDYLSKGSFARCDLVGLYQSSVSEQANIQLFNVVFEGAESLHFMLVLSAAGLWGNARISLVDVAWRVPYPPSFDLTIGYAVSISNTTMDNCTLDVHAANALGTGVGVLFVVFGMLHDVRINIGSSTITSFSVNGALALISNVGAMTNVTLDVDNSVVVGAGGIGVMDVRSAACTLSIRTSSITAAQPVYLTGISGNNNTVAVQLQASNATVLTSAALTYSAVVSMERCTACSATISITRCFFAAQADTTTTTTTTTPYVVRVGNSTTLHASTVLLSASVLLSGVSLLQLAPSARVVNASSITALGVQYLGTQQLVGKSTGALVMIGEHAVVDTSSMDIRASLVAAGGGAMRLLYVARDAVLANASIRFDGATASADERDPAICLAGGRLSAGTTLEFNGVVGESHRDGSIPVVLITAVVAGAGNVAVVFSNCRFISNSSSSIQMGGTAAAVAYASTMAVYNTVQSAGTTMSVYVHQCTVARYPPAGGSLVVYSTTPEIFVGNNSVRNLTLQFSQSTLGGSGSTCNVRVCNNTAAAGGGTFSAVAVASRFVAATHNVDVEQSAAAAGGTLHTDMSLINTTMVVLGGEDVVGQRRVVVALWQPTATATWHLALDRVTLVGQHLQVATVKPATHSNGSIDVACSWWGRHAWSLLSLVSVTQLKAVSSQPTLVPVTFLTTSPSAAHVTCFEAALGKPASVTASDSATMVSASSSAALSATPTATRSASSERTASSSIVWTASPMDTTTSRGMFSSTASNLSSASFTRTATASKTMESPTASRSPPVSPTASNHAVSPTASRSPPVSPTASNHAVSPTASRSPPVSPTASSHAVSPTASASPTPTILVVSMLAAPRPPDASPIASAAVAAVASAMLGAGAMADAAALASLSMLTCGGQASWDSNTGVQRLVVSVFYDLGPMFAVVGNMAVVAVGFAMHWGAVAAFGALRGPPANDDGGDAIASTLRFPSFSHGLFCFLFPGLLFAVAHAGSRTDDPVSVAVAVLGALAGVAGMAMAVRHARLTVWPAVMTVSLADAFHTHLPPRFLQWLGWALPAVMWLPRDARLQQSTFFGTVATRRLFPLLPLLQYHGALFAFVAALPFPHGSDGSNTTIACAVQFGLLMLWTIVPIVVVVCIGRMQAFRRPLNNSLGVATNVLTMEVLASTAVYFEGPLSMRDGALEARAVGGWLLTCVSVMKVLATVFAIVVERYALVGQAAASSSVVKDVQDNATAATHDEWAAREEPSPFEGFVLGHGLRLEHLTAGPIGEGDSTLPSARNDAVSMLNDAHRRLPVRAKLHIALMDQEICRIVVSAMHGGGAHRYQHQRQHDVLSLLVRRITAASSCYPDCARERGRRQPSPPDTVRRGGGNRNESLAASARPW